MFVPKTERIKKLAEKYEKVIKELENIFDKATFGFIWHYKRDKDLLWNVRKQFKFFRNDW